MQPSMDLKNDATIPRMPKMHFHMPLQANKSHSFPLTMQLSTLTFQIARQTELDIHRKQKNVTTCHFLFFFVQIQFNLYLYLAEREDYLVSFNAFFRMYLDQVPTDELRASWEVKTGSHVCAKVPFSFPLFVPPGN